MLPWRSTPTPADDPHSRPSGNCGFQLSSHLYGFGAEAACAKSATEAPPTMDTRASHVTTFLRDGRLCMAILRLHPPRFGLANQAIRPTRRRRPGERSDACSVWPAHAFMRMFVDAN